MKRSRIPRQSACLVGLCRYDKKADSSLVPLQSHLCRFCSSYKCAISKPKMERSRVQGKAHALLICDAMPKKLTAVLCHCSHTCAGFALHSSVPSPNLNETQQDSKAKCMPCWSVAMTRKLTAVLCHCSHTCAGFALHTSARSPNLKWNAAGFKAKRMPC